MLILDYIYVFCYGVSIDRYVSFSSPNVYLKICIFLLSICLLTDTVFNHFKTYVTNYIYIGYFHHAFKLNIMFLKKYCFLPHISSTYIREQCMFVCLSLCLCVSPSTFQVFQLQFGSVRYCWKVLRKCFEVLNRIQNKTEPLKP